MILKKVHAYVGLLHADGSEPCDESGYSRAYAGEVTLQEIQYLLQQDQIVFPDVKEPGYGYIGAMAMFTEPMGGEPMWIWNMPELMDVHEGVTPVIHDGKLYRGVEVKAKVIMQSDGACMI